MAMREDATVDEDGNDGDEDGDDVKKDCVRVNCLSNKQNGASFSFLWSQSVSTQRMTKMQTFSLANPQIWNIFKHLVLMEILNYKISSNI